MYKYEYRIRAVQLYIKYDLNIARVIRELGYPTRQMLYNWYKEYNVNGVLRKDDDLGYSKYNETQKRRAVQYYLDHGQSVSRTIKVLGYPGRTMLRTWIEEALLGSGSHCFTGKTLIRYSQKQKEQAVIRLCSGENTAKEIATEIGTTESSIYAWRRCLFSERDCVSVPIKDTTKGSSKVSNASSGQRDFVSEKKELVQQVEDLKKEVHRLQMERDILEKAGELLKKGQGINLKTITNQEKAVLIDALRDKYRLKAMLAVLDMAKSSYCYQKCALNRPDKHACLRSRVKEIFADAYSCYGYRRIHAAVRREGFGVSEKIIRRIMRDECLVVSNVRKRRYSSYIGEISPEVENHINRDFSADAPNAKWLTDITEFSISAGKVYLSPIIDCFDGMPIAWTIGTSPNAELVNSMLDAAISALDDDEKPIIHSDRGGHYRWPGWIERVRNAGLTRSMSQKGCSPDNSACEGFFGKVKNEMFYSRSWLGISLEDFMHALDTYLRWYNESRIKMSLQAMSPVEFRRSLGMVTPV
jgi:putative transposase